MFPWGHDGPGPHRQPSDFRQLLARGAVASLNSEAARDHYAELANIVVPECGGQGSQARCAALIDALDRMVVNSGLKPRLRDHGIPDSDIPMLAREAMKQQRLLVNNPVPILEDDARRLYEAAW